MGILNRRVEICNRLVCDSAPLCVCVCAKSVNDSYIKSVSCLLTFIRRPVRAVQLAPCYLHAIIENAAVQPRLRQNQHVAVLCVPRSLPVHLFGKRSNAYERKDDLEW